MSCENESVQVAVRIRPLIEIERNRGCQNILEVFPDVHQIRVKDHAFTYNYVFEGHTAQEQVYNSCVKHMIDNLFKGYNVTILAYGQTGSGKTHSMGTAYDGEGEMGIIPRAVNDIFNYINDNFTYDFTITLSFVELYQEVLYDLLALKPRDQCVVDIREDGKNIIIPGLTEESVKSASETLECLIRGSRGRVTGTTNMNSQSSRSHAIFTINICMQKKDDSNLNKTAKFHLVDLAGSERSKKTGATGQTFREGVNINKGLFVLGNVISALADDKQHGYICYRDSNLTRLLKDSLGGNSITLMIACISPADYNLEESLSTLRYADRARKIKNKPIVNQDPKTAEINRLKKLVQQLQLELIGQGGPIICQAELEQLKREIGTLKTKNNELMLQLSSSLNENANVCERLMLVQSTNEQMCKKLLELKDEYNITISNLNTSIGQNDTDAIKQHVSKLQCMEELFTNINSERQKAEDEIRKQERYGSPFGSVDMNLVAESEFSARQESHTNQQIAMNTELQEITKMVAVKEHLVQQILANTYHMTECTSMAINEEKITTLEREKDELLQQLKVVQTTESNGKIADQRRKRVQELEKEIQHLRKKITEQARLIKLKEKDEQKIKQLNTEILQMKSVKVKLIKNMKQESEKFRSWKLQREKELHKLKEKDRKQQNQMVKMEIMHNREKNVLKRKAEATAAINKRLKDALALRKTVQEQKNSGKMEKIGSWAQQELEIYVSIIDAEATVASLMDDRAALVSQLDKLKTQPTSTDSETIKLIEDSIELQSAQISELQQKILDSDHENREKTRWDYVQTMAEAKQLCKALFELTANIRRKQINNEVKIADLENTQAECIKKMSQLENQIKHLKMEHLQESSEITNKYEEKISVLLRQLCGVRVEGINEEFQKRCDIQQQALETAEQEIDDLKQENLQLSHKLEEINRLKFATPKPIKTTVPGIQKKKNQHVVFQTITLDDEWDENDEDNEEVDPDWRNTPLAKRIKKLKNVSLQPQAAEQSLTVKRRSDGSCACRGNCSRKNCGCKRLSRTCGSECKCSELCENKINDKENENESQTTTTTTTEEEEGSFKCPITSFDIKRNPKRSRKVTNLFQ